MASADMDVSSRASLMSSALLAFEVLREEAVQKRKLVEPYSTPSLLAGGYCGQASLQISFFWQFLA
jgi:hypothetical protein